LATAVLSAFMSSTGTVAIMLPIVMRLAYTFGVSPSRFLIPVAYAAMVGGTLTLIATPPNLVASQVLDDAGFGPLGFFGLTPIGLVLLAVTVVYVTTVGRWLLRDRAPSTVERSGHEQLSMREVAQRYELERSLHRVVVPASSQLLGSTLADLRWPETRRIQVVAIDTDSAAVTRGERSRRHLAASKRIGPFTNLEVGDRLLLRGADDAVDYLVREYGLVRLEHDEGEALVPRNLRFVELLVTPRSRWLGRTLSDIRFRERYRAMVVAMKRGGTVLTDDIQDESIHFGDVLLVRGRSAAIEELLRERQAAVVISEATSPTAPAPAAGRAWLALVILVVMLAAM